MARARNELPTVPITLSTTPQVIGYLKELLKTGLYGKNHAEAAERLLARTLDQLLSEGRINRKGGGRNA